jgi:hypothetical protein
MSTIIVALIIVFGVIGISAILIYMHNRHLKTKKKNFFFV